MCNTVPRVRGFVESWTSFDRHCQDDLHSGQFEDRLGSHAECSGARTKPAASHSIRHCPTGQILTFTVSCVPPFDWARVLAARRPTAKLTQALQLTKLIRVRGACHDWSEVEECALIGRCRDLRLTAALDSGLLPLTATLTAPFVRGPMRAWRSIIRAPGDGLGLRIPGLLSSG